MFSRLKTLQVAVKALLLEGCSRMMSVREKSRDWTVFSKSATLVMSSTQATVGQASIIGPKVPSCTVGETRGCERLKYVFSDVRIPKTSMWIPFKWTWTTKVWKLMSNNSISLWKGSAVCAAHAVSSLHYLDVKGNPAGQQTNRRRTTVITTNSSQCVYRLLLRLLFKLVVTAGLFRPDVRRSTVTQG